MLKKKSDEKQILSNNKSKALINNLIDQVEFFENEPDLSFLFEVIMLKGCK